MYDAKNYSPKITTVEYPYEEIGELACFHIFYNDKENFEVKDIFVDPRYIFTQSCGCDENKGVSFEEFRKIHFLEKEKNIRINLDSTRMSTDFITTSKIEDFYEVLKKYIKELECKEFYLCLYEDWYNDEINTLTKTVNDIEVVMAYTGGRFIERKTERTKAFRNMNRKVTDGKTNLFFPLNFKGKMFGYLVFCDYYFPIESALFPGWLTNIGIGLEGVCRQRMMDRMVEKLNETYLIDSLTGLYNRTGFDKYSKSILEECKLKEKNICVFFLDMDDLKSVNDRYGHDEGDRYIKSVAEILKRTLGEKAVMMRYGGDEFVAILAGCSMRQTKQYINSIKKEMELKTENEELPYKISSSIGFLNTIPTEKNTIEDFISVADKAMYEDKKHISSYGTVNSQIEP
jgi:diguanylate cyclase (GGDEF)-like protein